MLKQLLMHFYFQRLSPSTRIGCVFGVGIGWKLGVQWTVAGCQESGREGNGSEGPLAGCRRIDVRGWGWDPGWNGAMSDMTSWLWQAERRRRRRGRRAEDEEEEPMDEEMPIDVLENIRGRSIKDHVSDEAVAKEIERRFQIFRLC